VNNIGVDTPLVDPYGFPRGDIDVYRARSLRGRLAEIKTDHKKLMKDIETYLQQLSSLQNSSKSEQEKKEYEARLQSKPKPKYDPVIKKWVVRNWDGTIAGAGTGHDQRSFETIGSTVVPPVQATAAMHLSSNNNNNDASSTPENTTTTPVIHHPAANTSPTQPFARVNSVAPNSPAAAAGLKEGDLVLAFGPITMDAASSFQAVGELVPRAAASNETIEIRVQRISSTAETSATTTVSILLKPRPWSGRGLIGCHIVPVV
jgi:hypothetical protein